MSPDLAQAITASAGRLGADPLDLATVISYETAGTFDPWKAGPTTQYGQHRGLIQWGEPQRQEYGVTQGMPVADQMRAVEKYLTKAGFQPGMGIMDMYSAVNAGRVGRYGASDANNGGAPGTVADKVNNQMGGHRQKAAQMLGLPGGTGGLSFGAAQPNVQTGPSSYYDIVNMFGDQTAAPVIVAPEAPAAAPQMQQAAAARQAVEGQRRQALFADIGSWFG